MEETIDNGVQPISAYSYSTWSHPESGLGNGPLPSSFNSRQYNNNFVCEQKGKNVVLDNKVVSDGFRTCALRKVHDPMLLSKSRLWFL